MTPDVLAKIYAVQRYTAAGRQASRTLGVLLFVTALFWVAWKFVQHRGMLPRLALSARKTFALLGSVVIIQTALMAVLFKLAEFTALQNVRAPMNDPTLWAFAIPFATASLLMTLLADRPTALFTGMLSALYRRHHGTARSGIHGLCGDRVVCSCLRHRALSQPSDRYDRRCVHWRSECGVGCRSSRIYAAAVYPEYSAFSTRHAALLAVLSHRLSRPCCCRFASRSLAFSPM